MHARSFRWLVMLAAIAAAPSSAFAWGKTGHRVVAAIADTQLSGFARAHVEQILGPGESHLPPYVWIKPGGGGFRPEDGGFLGPKYGSLAFGDGLPPDDLLRNPGQRLLLASMRRQLTRCPDCCEEPGLFERAQQGLAVQFSKGWPECFGGEGCHIKLRIDQLEPLHGQMRSTTSPGRCVVEFAWHRLRQRDELSQVRRRNTRF